MHTLVSLFSSISIGYWCDFLPAFLVAAVGKRIIVWNQGGHAWSKDLVRSEEISIFYFCVRVQDKNDFWRSCQLMIFCEKIFFSQCPLGIAAYSASKLRSDMMIFFLRPWTRALPVQDWFLFDLVTEGASTDQDMLIFWSPQEKEIAREQVHVLLS